MSGSLYRFRSLVSFVLMGLCMIFGALTVLQGLYSFQNVLVSCQIFHRLCADFEGTPARLPGSVRFKESSDRFYTGTAR